MKRRHPIFNAIISFVMVFALSGIPQAFAAEADTSSVEPEGEYTTYEPNFDQGEGSGEALTTQSGGASGTKTLAPTAGTTITTAGERTLRVTVMQGSLPVEDAQFTISASSTSGASASETVTAQKTDNNYRKAETVLRHLKDAEYTVTISAPQAHFATYEQTVTLNGYDAAITVYTNNVTTSGAQPGVMIYGDLNGDGTIDSVDATLMVDRIQDATASVDESGVNTYATEHADSNLEDFDGLDAAIDLIDLQVVAEGLKATPTDSAVKQLVPASVITASGASSTTLTGDVSQVLNGTSDNVLGLGTTGSRAISASNPVSVSFDFTQAPAAASGVEGVVIGSPADAGTAISQGDLAIETTSGSTINVPLKKQAAQTMGTSSTSNTSSSGSLSTAAASASDASGDDSSNSLFKLIETAYAAETPVATFDANGAIVVDFSGKIAIKKVTIRITETVNKANLAEITTVEFLNNMDSNIAPPEMNIPSNIVLKAGSNEFAVSWNKEPNVTGYSISYVEVNPDTKAVIGSEEFARTAKTSTSIKQYSGKKMKNGHTFAVKVESLNGDWRSGWSAAQYVTPRPNGAPPAPENVKITAGFRSLTVNWKDMDDTDTYEVFYRQRTDQSERQAPYTKWIDGNGSSTINNNSCVINGLSDNTTYQVYVVGHNAEFGAGPRSTVSIGTTITIELAELPEYFVVNTRNASNQYRNNIANAWAGRGDMLGSSQDSAADKTAWGLFDNNAESRYYINDWDDGGAYPVGGYPRGNKGVSVSFTSPQDISMISLAELASNNVAYGFTYIQYRGEGDTSNQNVGASIHQRTGSNGQKYYLIKLARPVKATWMNIGVGRCDSRNRDVTISELRFHNDGGLENDILSLYTDNLYLQLRDDVTEATIDALQKRLDTPDPTSGELHPFRSSLQIELNAARQLLKDGPNLDDILNVDNTITAQKDNRSLGIGGLNAWQPLGISGGTGEDVIIYVGAPGATRGKNSSLQLVMTQQHPEAASVSTTVCTLKNGRNEITLPSLVSSDLERGGQLYVVYGANNANDKWAVRVAGGTRIPTLNLHQVTDESERLSLVTAYVNELNSHVSDLQSTHNKLHQQSSVAALKYSYDDHNCIANATDVMLDEMMYSVPASQMLAAAGNGSVAQKAAHLLNAFDSMDQMMELFYQHKGLATADVEGVTEANKVPYQHLNIRYCRMFAGAFMYAAGNHIGIEWGSVGGLGQQMPTVNDAGLKTSGSYFGWGIAHEIGHQINQAQYAYAEVTNNYFAQVGKTDETEATARWNIADVYDRVTSGEIGRTRDVSTQLAMYWQLHLAYDPGHVAKIHGTYDDILKSYFFARVDSYARNPQSAPAPGGVALSLNAGESQNIFRLSCAAAQKDLTEFFTRWGIIPDAASKAYASQFAAETKAFFYGNDDQKNFATANNDAGQVQGADVVRVNATPNGSEVTLNMSVNGQLNNILHGYEITRVTVAQGEEQREVVGFTTSDTFVDDASHLGNRVVAYEVSMVDKFLNRSNTSSTDWIKLDGDGRIAHDGWTATTNMTSADDVAFAGDEDDPDSAAAASAITKAIDGDRNTTYVGTASIGDAYVEIDLGMVRELTSVRYSFDGSGSPITDYVVKVSTDGANFREIGAGTFTLNGNNQAMAYFSNGSDPWICTYDVRYVRLEATGKTSVGISEIDLYGPSGDNVDFLESNGDVAIGSLASDYVYQKASGDLTEQTIPAGSLVFTGEFKGNPAYNVVVLYDDKGNIVGGVDSANALVAHQIILADDPAGAMIGETSSGRWVYWIEPADLTRATSIGTKVRAELYRVDNALTNEGQRLTSDSIFTTMPSLSALPSVTIEAS